MTRWLSRQQVAEKLGTHPNTIYKLEKRPDFPKRSSAMSQPRWREDEIDAYMEEGRKAPRQSEASPKRQGAQPTCAA